MQPDTVTEPSSPLRSAYLPYSYVRKDCAHRDAKTSAPQILSLTSSQFVFQESEWWYTVLSLPITLYSLNIPKSCFYTSPYFIVGFPWALLFSLSPFPFGEGWDRESELCGWVYGGFCCYLLILLQFCQCRGGIISDLCRSQSLGTSHSMTAPLQ